MSNTPQISDAFYRWKADLGRTSGDFFLRPSHFSCSKINILVLTGAETENTDCA